VGSFQILVMRQDIKMKEMVENVLENFDFEKVYLTMRALNWTWGYNVTTPTIEQMKSTARYLMEGAINGAKKSENLRQYEPYFNATGGFKAYCFINRHKHIVSLHLEFIVSEWETDGD
jgi:hypothetical protein